MIMTVDEVREGVKAALARLKGEGLSNKDMAERLGVSIPTLIRLKKGERIDGTTAAVVTLISKGTDQAA